MAWTFGFFNSVNGDRLYNADQMSSIFEGLISNGVYESVGNKLAVQPNNGMTIQIATGRGWFNRRWVNNDSAYTLTVANSDVTLSRYAAVVIKVDTNSTNREVVPYIKYGEFSSNPLKPNLERSEYVNEYCLAYILIKPNVTEIKASDIEDTRANKYLCGWVVGLIDQLDETTLFTQFTALFNEWFSGLQDLIDENVETMLVNALPTNDIITLAADGWNNKTQDVTVLNMNDTKSVIIQSTDQSLELYSKYNIKCTGQSTNTLSFTCDSVPPEDIYIKIVHMGV